MAFRVFKFYHTARLLPSIGRSSRIEFSDMPLRTNWYSSCFASFATHAAVLGALHYGFSTTAPIPLAVEQGRASIESLASITATAAAPNEVVSDLEEPPVVDIESMEPKRVVDSLAHQRRETEPIVEPPAKLEVGPLLTALEPPPVEALAVRPQPQPRMERAVVDEPLAVPTATEPLPRRPLPEVDVELAAVDALAAPDSQAVAGAEIDEFPRTLPTNLAPRYPKAAQAASQQGLVIVLVRVAANGTVMSLRVETSSGFPLLDAAAVDGVRAWRFEPGRARGVPIEAEVPVPIRFRIK